MTEKKVLVVEENEALLDVLSKTLIRHGYGVVGAQNGVAALTIPQEESIDLVVLDHRLSVVDGAKTAVRLRRAERSHYLPVLLLVPKELVSDEENQDLHGADTFIHIPTDAESLVRKIRELLEEKEARDKARGMLRDKVRQDLEQAVEEVIRDTFQDKTERMLSDLSQGLVEMLEIQARDELRTKINQISEEEFAARINELVEEFTRPLVEEIANEIVTRLSSDMIEERIEELTRAFEREKLPALIDRGMQKATEKARIALVESVQNDVKESIVADLLQNLPSLMERMANRTLPLAADKYLPAILDKQVAERVNKELTTKGRKIVERQVLQDVRRIGLRRISRYIFFGLFFSVIALSAAVAALIKYAPEWLPKVPLP